MRRLGLLRRGCDVRLCGCGGDDRVEVQGRTLRDGSFTRECFSRRAFGNGLHTTRALRRERRGRRMLRN